MNGTITLDGKEVPFKEGETIIEAATSAGIYDSPIGAITRILPHMVVASSVQ